MAEPRGVLAVIPARAGSVGLPDKNVRPLLGRPMLAWSIAAAAESGLVEDVIVSTDSPRYADIAREWGAQVPFLRPATIAGSATGMMAVLQHAVAELAAQGRTYDLVLTLQPTSPLRGADHVRAAMALFDEIADPDKALASVCEAPAKYAWLLRTDDAGRLSFLDQQLQGRPGYGRQRIQNVYLPNGAIFLMQSHLLTSQYTEHTYAYVMSGEDSWDVDDEADFRHAEEVLRARRA